jgi:4-hydroxy-tetrahydrodipicolinate synthase
MSSFKIKGIIAAMVTPLTEDQKIHKEAIHRLLNYLIDGGVHGVFVISGAGEFASLTLQEKKDLLEAVVDEVNGRIPVYAGAGAVTTREAVHVTEIAEKIGADVISVIAPYAISPSQDELHDHYTEIAKSTNLPVILYNHPKRTGVNLSVDLVVKLAKVDNIVGIKDSSGDLALTMEYIRQNGEDFSVLAGIDTLIFPSLVCGAQGSISSTANVAPELVVKIYESFMNGNYEAARQAQYELIPLRRAFALGTFPAVLKEALTMINIPVGPPIRSVKRLNQENRRKLRQVLERMNIL